MINEKHGFTLVELIVVITILSILGTIAFISLGNYSINARDSTRFTDIKSIEAVLENAVVKRGLYPVPTNPVAIVYSGGTVFRQGTFGDATHLQVTELSKKPIDPLYEREYTYSLSSTKKSYNISWVQEGDSISYNTFGNKANAETAAREMVARVSGRYNGQIVHTSTGGIVYVFAIPSLILTDTGDRQILNLSNKFVYDNEANIPLSYSGANINQVGSFQFTPKLVFSGATLPRTPAALKTLVQGVQEALLGTILYSKPAYREVIELDTEDSNDLYYYGREYINKDLGGRFVLSYPNMCRSIVGTDDNDGSGMYTISPNGNDKIDVYCDMEMDGGGWTRVRKRERGLGYTDLKTINKTRGITGSQVIEKYTRVGAANTGKQYGIYYTKFKTRQNDQNGLCGEHTTIADLILQITGGSRGDCSRSDCNVGTDPNCTQQEYIDIQVDDLGEDIGLTDDKDWSALGFSDDPCIVNGHKDIGLSNRARNVSWTSMGAITHRTDSSTTLTTLGGTSSNSGRCHGTYDDANWGFQTNEVYVR